VKRSNATATSICFGKLPITGDFLRGDGSAPEFSELDDWIQHGMYESQQRMGNRWQECFDALPRTRFIWAGANHGPVIAGWWQASRDSVGRRYPFLIAARIPSITSENYLALPFALEGYLADAARLLDSGFDGLDVVQAIAKTQDLVPSFDWPQAQADRIAAFRQANTQSAWEGQPDIPELLLHDLEQVSGQYNPPQYSLRWKSCNNPVDVSFWLTAMAKFGQATARILMWHDDTSDDQEQSRPRPPACLRVALGGLQPRLFPGIVFSDLEDDDAYDMGLGATEDKRTQSARARFAGSVRASNHESALAAFPSEGY
jgi:type VI secretion system ImpM family protein